MQTNTTNIAIAVALITKIIDYFWKIMKKALSNSMVVNSFTTSHLSNPKFSAYLSLSTGWVMNLRQSAILSFLLIFIIFLFPIQCIYSAEPGLPFTEDFSSDSLIDKIKTTTAVNTEEKEVRLAWAKRQYGAFEDPSFFDISREKDETNSIAVGGCGW